MRARTTTLKKNVKRNTKSQDDCVLRNFNRHVGDINKLIPVESTNIKEIHCLKDLSFFGHAKRVGLNFKFELSLFFFQSVYLGYWCEVMTDAEGNDPSHRTVKVYAAALQRLLRQYDYERWTEELFDGKTTEMEKKSIFDDLEYM